MCIPAARSFARYRFCSMLQYSCSLALLVLHAADGLASVHPDLTNIAQKLNSPGLVWDEPEPMFAGGVAMHTASFMSSQSADNVAREFSDASDMFDRLLTMPDHLVLSGIKDNWHWLALISVSSSGAHGYLSTMHAGPASSGAVHPWLPLNTPADFSFKGVAEGKSFTQHAHRFSGPAYTVRARVKEQLIREGWKHQVSTDATDAQWHWYRAGEQLFILTAADKGGTLVFTHHVTRSAGQ